MDKQKVLTEINQSALIYFLDYRQRITGDVLLSIQEPSDLTMRTEYQIL